MTRLRFVVRDLSRILHEQLLPRTQDGDLVWFNIITFAADTRLFSNVMVPATEDHVWKAKDFLRSLQARGPTNAGKAISIAFDKKVHETVEAVYYLGDGQPSYGSESPFRTLGEMLDHLKAVLRERNEGGNSCHLHATAMLCGVEKDSDYQMAAQYIEDLATKGQGMFRCIIEDKKTDIVNNFIPGAKRNDASELRTVTTSSLITAGGLNIQLMTLGGFLFYIFICYFARDPESALTVTALGFGRQSCGDMMRKYSINIQPEPSSFGTFVRWLIVAQTLLVMSLCVATHKSTGLLKLTSVYLPLHFVLVGIWLVLHQLGYAMLIYAWIVMVGAVATAALCYHKVGVGNRQTTEFVWWELMFVDSTLSGQLAFITYCFVITSLQTMKAYDWYMLNMGRLISCALLLILAGLGVVMVVFRKDFIFGLVSSQHVRCRRTHNLPQPKMHPILQNNHHPRTCHRSTAGSYTPPHSPTGASIDHTATFFCLEQ